MQGNYAEMFKTQENVKKFICNKCHMYGMQDDFSNKHHAILSKNEPLLSVEVYEKGLGLAQVCARAPVFL